LFQLKWWDFLAGFRKIWVYLLKKPNPLGFWRFVGFWANISKSLADELKQPTSFSTACSYKISENPIMARTQNKKAQLSLTNPRDACEKFARFT